jgi:MFS family permease
VALFALAGAPDRVIATACMIVIGGGLGVFTPIAWGVLQEISPEHLVARILTIYGTGAMAAAIAGMTLFGWLTQQFGERSSVVGIGLVLVATAGVAIGFSRWIRFPRPGMPNP